MQRYRRGGALLVSLSALALAGCHHSETGTTNTIVLDANAPVATVNGQSINQQQFFSQLQGYRPNAQQVGLPAGQMVLRQLINGVMYEELAQQMGVAPQDSEVDAIYNTEKAATEVQSVKTFDQVLTESGVTPDDIKTFTIKPQLAQLNIIQKESGMKAITDADINAFYTQNKATFTAPDRAHIKRIVLRSAADAQRIYSQIQKGQSFDTLVSQSIDHQYPGGDVPFWVNLDAPPPPQLVPPAMLPALKSAAAAKSSPANVTPPFKSGNLFWIVQVVDTRPKAVIPLDQVKEYIHFLLMARAARTNPAAVQQLQQQLLDFQSKAKFDIPDPRYKQLLAALQAPPPPPPGIGIPNGAAPAAP